MSMRNAVNDSTLTELSYFERGVADPVSLGDYMTKAIKFMKHLGQPNDTDISDDYIAKLSKIFIKADTLYKVIGSGINKNEIPNNANNQTMLKVCEAISRHYGSNCTVVIKDKDLNTLISSDDLSNIPSDSNLEVSAVRDHTDQIPDKSAIMGVINDLVDKLVSIHNEEA